MSGFVAMLSLDGAPVDRSLLTRMTDSLAFRGPDTQATWVGDIAGMGHAMLLTKEGERLEQQPCSLDREVWIVGDIRVDARSELIEALSQAGHRPERQATDPELVLHAYACWGRGLVDHLLGDFSFVIWDGRQRLLFGARDQLGVKPFYYGVADGRLFISNTLSCLTTHTRLGDEIDEAAIGDFLLYGFNANLKTTSYKRIARLQGGHVLSWSLPSQAVAVSLYWNFEDHGELRLSRPQDYVERFRHLLKQATADRLRTSRAGMWMSGGLDSTLVAATARSLLPRGDRQALVAHCCVYDRLIPDQERHYAEIAAAGLGIPVRFYPGDDFGLNAAERRRPHPEPLDDHVRPAYADHVNRAIAACTRVALTGIDGDGPLRASWKGHFQQVLTKGAPLQAIRDAIDFARAKQGLGAAAWRRMPWNGRGGSDEEQSAYPQWLDPDFEKRNHLRERWESEAPEAVRSPHGTRSAAYRAMTLPRWARLFELHDAGVTGVPVDCRHPLLDLRLLRFLLALPAVPWCIDKHIMRSAAKGLLPETVRQRPKTGLRGDPTQILAEPFLADVSQHLHPNDGLARFIDIQRFNNVLERNGTEPYWVNVRPVILNRWLGAAQRNSDDGD